LMSFCDLSGCDWGAWSTPEAEVVACASVVCHLLCICCGSWQAAGPTTWSRDACWKAVFESRNRRAAGRHLCKGDIMEVNVREKQSASENHLPLTSLSSAYIGLTLYRLLRLAVYSIPIFRQIARQSSRLRELGR
jgi:hypothetical protein